MLAFNFVYTINNNTIKYCLPIKHSQTLKALRFKSIIFAGLYPNIFLAQWIDLTDVTKFELV